MDNYSLDKLFAAIESQARESESRQAADKREKTGALTKRIRTTAYACAECAICKLSNEYSNNESFVLFIKQGIIAEKIKNETIKDKPKKKPFFMEYFDI